VPGRPGPGRVLGLRRRAFASVDEALAWLAREIRLATRGLVVDDAGNVSVTAAG